MIYDHGGVMPESISNGGGGSRIHREITWHRIISPQLAILNDEEVTIGAAIYVFVNDPLNRGGGVRGSKPGGDRHGQSVQDRVVRNLDISSGAVKLQGRACRRRSKD